MPLPIGTAALKIHPAIGFARLSTNDDTYVFGEPQHPLPSYKSNGLIKRQAVRFRIFAYDSNNKALAELTPELLFSSNLRAVWHVRVANRKTAKERGDDSYTISATARSDHNGGQLNGRCGDFAEGQNIQLGEIRPEGLFIPPKAAFHRHTAGAAIPPDGMHDGNFTDNTSDGIVSVQIFDKSTNQAITVPIFDAWIVVCPPDFAPDFDDSSEPGSSRVNLLTYLTELLVLPNQAPVGPLNARAREIDRTVLERGTAWLIPGIEVSIPEEEMFYSGTTLNDRDEVRILPGSSIGAPGTLPGELTLGLCSPWQFDFRACTCSHWVNHRPDTAFRDDGTEVDWLRRHEAQDGEIQPGDPAELSSNADFIQHVYELGIVRRVAGRRVEKERSGDITDETS
jgi:hypothetical protein